MGSYLLGLDAGNTILKAVLFDLSGNEIAVYAKDGKSNYPQAGYVERDMNELWSQAQEAINGCIAKAGINAADIIAVGCSGHGNGLYLLDQDGEALLGIQSLDSRAMGLVERWQKDGTADALYPICLQKPWPSQTPTLLAWVKENDPETYAKIGTVFLVKDFVTHKLTGVLSSDYSDMSGCSFLKLPDRKYDRELLEKFGIADCEDKLPKLYEPSEIVGKVTQLAAEQTSLAVGTPVVAGLFDVVASALGSGVVELGEASIVAGTWSINQVIVEKPLVDDTIFMTASYADDRYMEIEASATSAANLEWFVKEFIEPGLDHDSGVSPFDICNDLVAGVKLDAALPLYHPFLYGSSTNGAARAGFYGIGGWHGRAEMLHALYEGVVFGHRKHVETLRAAGAGFNKVILSGGGSRSPVWPQMFADILDVPVTIAKCQETGALGAAIAAGIGAGVFGSYEAGVKKMTQLDRQYTPNAATQKTYAERYEIYNSLCDDLGSAWDTLKDISNN
ncbi:MAG: carbohydrate kinase [Rhizobiales bacterium]|nr:carbohydrate kinase [Hyphomicrobiales bacterium]NRB15521.1 carbohydrate kinase [Hyphomicrobiales bacterium]